MVNPNVTFQREAVLNLEFPSNFGGSADVRQAAQGDHLGFAKIHGLREESCSMLRVERFDK